MLAWPRPRRRADHAGCCPRDRSAAFDEPKAPVTHVRHLLDDVLEAFPAGARAAGDAVHANAAEVHHERRRADRPERSGPSLAARGRSPAPGRSRSLPVDSNQDVTSRFPRIRPRSRDQRVSGAARAVARPQGGAGRPVAGSKLARSSPGNLPVRFQSRGLITVDDVSSVDAGACGGGQRRERRIRSRVSAERTQTRSRGVPGRRGPGPIRRHW